LEGRMDTEKEIVLVLDNSGVLNSYVEDIYHRWTLEYIQIII